MATEFLITGARGQLGLALRELLGARAVYTDLPGLDVTSRESVSSAMDEHDPACIINCAAVTDVDLCQRDPGLAVRVHHDGVANLAGTGRRLLTISTDHVFTGSSGLEVPFVEDSPVDPANTYAESKLLGEEVALRARRDNVVVRTSWMFSGDNGLLPFIWRSLAREGRVRAVLDQRACLTYAPDLAAAIVELASGIEGGIYHLVSLPGVTPAELALRISSFCGGEVVKVRWSDLGLDAPRPLFSVLGTTSGIRLPDMDDAVERWRKSNVAY